LIFKYLPNNTELDSDSIRGYINGYIFYFFTAIKIGRYTYSKRTNDPENCENRNDPDLVQAFLKKWWVESDFKEFQ
jgi:hypothetical protein